MLAGDRRRRRPAPRPAAVGQPLARGARSPRAARAGGQAAVAARDRAHRAGHGPQPRAAARAAAAVDRPRRAGRGRRRGRRASPRSSTSPTSAPTSSSSRAGWSPASTRTRTREAVLRATAAFAREVGARIVAEGVERVEELEALRAMEIDYGQGWLFGRPGEAWPQEPSAAPAVPRPRAGLAAGWSATSSAPARRATRARRSSTTWPAAACSRRLPRPGGPPALPGRARLLAGLRRALAEHGHRRARLPHR